MMTRSRLQAALCRSAPWSSSRWRRSAQQSTNGLRTNQPQSRQQRHDQHRALALELEQATYHAGLAARRYEAVDPDNRLVAGELEARWNGALERVAELDGRLKAQGSVAPRSVHVDRETLESLATDLLNLNLHLHSLVLDGVYTRPTPEAVPVFHPLPAPTDDEVAKILERVHDRIQKLLRRRGRLPEDPSPTDPVAEPMPLLAGFAAASIQERLATGPRAGPPVRRLRTAAAVADTPKPRCARLEGFSLHANVFLPAQAREHLEHVCRYLLRLPLALERLTESSGGQLLYALPHARRDGSTHVLLDPLELIEKLSVLIPAPRFHTLRCHGVLAPHASGRSQIIPKPGEVVLPKRSIRDPTLADSVRENVHN